MTSYRLQLYYQDPQVYLAEDYELHSESAALKEHAAEAAAGWCSVVAAAAAVTAEPFSATHKNLRNEKKLYDETCDAKNKN